MSVRIKDRVEIKSQKDVIRNVEKIGKNYKRVIAWTQGSLNVEQTKETEMLKNLLISTESYIKYIASGAYKDIQILALGVRSVLENLARVRFIMQSEKNLNKWVSESLMDQKALVQAFKSIGNGSSDEVIFLEKELERLDALYKKYELPIVKQPQQFKAMTEAVNLVDDYESVFKLTSKLVHPSSLFINSNSSLNNFEYHNILVICGQLYLFSMLNEICEKLEAPESIKNIT
ncbi:hypothetical protein BCT10_02795 [Vibrio splendidus]|uniref:DUF5677 domain-containing protein n=1 Tax=Vibrio splendidus TaxID=29497 RepID=UPI000C8452DB|nr:DUF5677 domain-containing protein [Vibrio splendidus]PMO40638.1 hypothetical protein BCT10_02795 [Vibrio splendidus]